MKLAALRATLSHWRRHPRQLLTLVLGLSLATALWSGVQAINAEARAGYDRATDLARLTALAVVQRTDGAPPTLADYSSLRRAGWPVSPVLSGQIAIGEGRKFSLYGIDLITHPLATQLASSYGSQMELILDAGEVFAGPQTARRLQNAESLPPVRVIQGLAPGQIVADIAVVADLLDRPKGISAMVLTAMAPVPVPDGFRLTDAPPAADVRGMTDSFHLNLTAFGYLSFAVGLFILHSGVGLAIEQRRAILRTMRAIGVSLQTLVLVLSVELVLIAIFSSILGLVLGYAIAAALMPNVSATLTGLFGAPGLGSLQLRPSWVIAGVGVALAGTALAGAGALFRVATMPLLAPAMPRAWARGSRQSAFRLAGAGLALGVLAVGAGAFIDGLTGAFALLAGLFLMSALVLPAILTVGLAWFGRVSGKPIARWFWADTGAQLPGLSLSLMALMLALAANIGVGTMVSSFRQAFLGFLDQRLVSDLYVTARSDEEGRAIAQWLAPKAEAVLPIWRADTRLGGRPAEIYGIADHRRYRDRWPLQKANADVWGQVYGSGGALISEQLARREGILVGDKIDLAPGWTPVVSGIYADYGNPGGQVAVALPELLSRFPDVSKQYYGVIAARALRDQLRNDLIAEFELPPSAVTDRATVKAFSIEVFDRTFKVTAALNVLTLGIAVFAILTNLLTLSAMRLPQLAPVWALGLTRRHLAWLEVLRGVFLSALTFTISLPVGLALAWLLLKVVNAEAFGWRLPMGLFPLDWVRLFGLALSAGALSAAWPAWKLMRMSPAQLTQVFAHER